mgnify:CR=1 FL=1
MAGHSLQALLQRARRRHRGGDLAGALKDYRKILARRPGVAVPREIPVVGDPDEIVMARVKAFYNAISAMIEKECGLMAVPMINLSHEGFGRVVITVGKLVVMDRTLRDVHRFGFPTLSKMKDEADKLLSVALEIIGKHSDVAGM